MLGMPETPSSVTFRERRIEVLVQQLLHQRIALGNVLVEGASSRHCSIQQTTHTVAQVRVDVAKDATRGALRIADLAQNGPLEAVDVSTPDPAEAPANSAGELAHCSSHALQGIALGVPTLNTYIEFANA